ncbi:uncharacterized protein LOC144444675 [Glandiceps talaboti]
MKHTVYVFAKLQSFQSAALEVKKILTEMLDSDIFEVEMFPIDENPEHGKSSTATEKMKKEKLKVKTKNEVVTTVVVIDSNPTRTLITPARKDPAVDHWEELDMLSSPSVSQQGSVLVVIYGDDKSRNLTGKKMVSPQWLTAWQFNDPWAYACALKGLCLSIDKVFNDSQKERIKRYLAEVPLLPIFRSDVNILYLGVESTFQALRGQLERHPVLTEAKVDDETFVRYRGKFPPTNMPSIFIQYRKSGVLHLCSGSELKQELEKVVSTEILINQESESGVTSYLNKINRVIFACHCEKCLYLASKELVAICDFIGAKLRKNGVPFLGDVFPVVTNDEHLANQHNNDGDMEQPIDDQLLFNRICPTQRLKLVEGATRRTMLTMYIYHILQIPALLDRDREKGDEESIAHQIQKVENKKKNLQRQVKTCDETIKKAKGGGWRTTIHSFITKFS